MFLLFFFILNFLFYYIVFKYNIFIKYYYYFFILNFIDNNLNQQLVNENIQDNNYDISGTVNFILKVFIHKNNKYVIFQL